MVQENEVLAQLDRILQSNVFASAARSRQFLSFCVRSSLHGGDAHLKETTIALEVFLRQATYDPKSDPIVRVHARRVREKLEVYYRTVGRSDPIIIDLPKGSYIPNFVRSNCPHVSIPHRHDPGIQTAIPEASENLEGKRREPITESLVKAEIEKHNVLWRLVLIGCVAAIVLGFVLLRKTRREHTQSAPILWSLRSLDVLPRNAYDVAWSPDGKRVAFLQMDTQHRTFVFTMASQGSQTPLRLSRGEKTEYHPVWSSDGRQIAFVRMIDDVNFTIVRHDIASGAEVVTLPFVKYLSTQWAHPVLDWSPDGKYLLTAEQVSPGVPSRLVLVRVADGSRSFLTSPPIGSTGDIEAKFSPDGRSVAFHRGGLGDLYIIPATPEEDERPKQLTFDNRGVHGIAFTTDGQNILFGSTRSPDNTVGIYSIPIAGGSPVPLTPSGFSAVDPVVTNAAETAFRHVEIATEIVEEGRGVTHPKPLLTGNYVDQSPTFSPSGDAIAFISTRSGSEELWYLRLGQPTPEELTHFDTDGFLLTPHWSPNGNALAFCYRKNGATNIFLMDLHNRTLRQLTDTTSRNYNPVFSSDGKYIFYSSNEDGTPRLWRLAVEGHHKAEPLFTRALTSFVVSHDGQWMYYLDDEQPLRLLRLSLLNNTSQEIFRTEARPAFANSLVLTREGLYLALIGVNESKVHIERIDLTKPQPKTIWRLPVFSEEASFAGQSFDVSQDGAQLLTSRLTRDVSTTFTVTAQPQH